METADKMEHEINIEELFWKILFGWRQIIFVGILFAVLIGGLRYLKDIRAYQSAKNTDIGQAESELAEEEKQQVLEGRNLKARIEEYEDYLKNSALMQVDSYKKPVIELQYYVDSDYTFNYTQESQNDYTGNLVALYYNYIISGEMSEKVIEAAKLSISQEDVSELWAISQVGSSILIKFTCLEEREMELIAKTIKEQLEKKEKEFQEVGTHELKLLGESQNIVVDTVLGDRKNAISNNISSLNTQLTNLKTNMTEKQLALMDNGQLEGNMNTNVEPTFSKPNFSLKYIILGAILGIFIVCGWIVCRTVFNAKLQYAAEIRVLYNTRLLGEINNQEEKKRLFSIIDKKLLEIKNRKKKKLTVEQQIKLIIANIVLFCKQERIECIYLTGSEYEKADKRILEMLKKGILDQNIQVKEGGNIFYDADSLKRGTEIGNILFVEQKNVSIYDEISNELNLAKEQKNNILGVIVFV